MKSNKVNRERIADLSEEDASEQDAEDTDLSEADETVEDVKSGSIRQKIAMVVIPLILVMVGWYSYQWWTVGQYIVSTNDAYIKADTATIAAKVSGYVSKIEVSDHASLKKGDVIARIDDGDFRLSVQAASDNIASQKATIDRIDRQVTAQMAMFEQAKAKLAAADANMKRAAAELRRQKGLARRRFASQKTLDEAEAGSAQAVAEVTNARAAVEAAKAEVEVVKARKLEASGVLRQLETALVKAKRDLSFTVIRAPFAGVLGNRAIQTGEYVTSGKRLVSLVKLNEVYIDANFKETQLTRLNTGQPVEIEVDAVPGHVFHGQVVSFSPASGSQFSLLPPDNATGNFTKIVQRIPVRIRIEQKVSGKHLLRPGMSVIVSVNTKPQVSGSAQAATR
ncbi:MAG: HlyD family secretion protein [Methyloligellaceae bacterium]